MHLSNLIHATGQRFYRVPDSLLSVQVAHIIFFDAEAYLLRLGKKKRGPSRPCEIILNGRTPCTFWKINITASSSASFLDNTILVIDKTMPRGLKNPDELAFRISNVDLVVEAIM